MDEISVISTLKEFVTGNTLVFLYIAYSFTRYILVPVFRGGKVVKDLVTAATNALNGAATGHAAIAAEIKALNEILSQQKTQLKP